MNKLLNIVLLIVFCACTKSKLNYNDYVAYLRNAENGLVQTREIGGVKITVKYLPVDYLAYNELQTNVYNQQVLDSVKKRMPIHCLLY